MRGYYFLIVVLVCGLAVGSSLQESVHAVQSSSNTYRQLSVEGTPNLQDPTKLSVASVEADLQKGDTGAAELDVAGFAMANPRNTGNGMDYYFGEFSARADWSAPSGTSSVKAALNEVVASFSSVYTWKNFDGKPGFQYTIGNDIWDCAKAEAAKFDCVANNLELKTLSWGTISREELACPAGYESDCKIYAFETTGTSIFGDVTFTLKLASQPVMLGSMQIDPNYGKIDVLIEPNWTGVTDPNLKVGLFAYVGGKSLSGSIEATRVDDNAALVFAGEKKSAYFSWEGVANVGTVYASSLTYETLKNYDCSDCGLVEALVVLAYKVVGGAWEAFGWKVQLVFFSWNADKPQTVFWDPKIGMSSDAFAMSPIFALVMALVSLLLAH